MIDSLKDPHIEILISNENISKLHRLPSLKWGMLKVLTPTFNETVTDHDCRNQV